MSSINASTIAATDAISSISDYETTSGDDDDFLSLNVVVKYNYSAVRTRSSSLFGSQYLLMRYYINDIIIPTIFAVGIVGNIVNLLLLTSSRLYPNRRQATVMERSAVTGLKALAVSDMLFCLVGFPASFIQNSLGIPSSDNPVIVVGVYYVHHKGAFLNVFLFTSTWLIVLVSVERYIAVCHPFRAGNLIRVRRTVIAQATVFVVAILLNVPLFLKFTIAQMPCSDNHTCYYLQPSYYFSQPIFINVHKVTWFVLGTFLPLFLILTSNALLVRELYNTTCTCTGGSRRHQNHHVTAAIPSERNSTLRLTLTLISVVVCFLIFVCPSMLLQFFKYAGGSIIDPSTGSGSGPITTDRFHTAVLITNLTQALKFSSNFLLYCVINRTFRQTFGRLLHGQYCRRHHHHHHHPREATADTAKKSQKEDENIQKNAVV